MGNSMKNTNPINPTTTKNMDKLLVKACASTISEKQVCQYAMFLEILKMLCNISSKE